MSRLVVDAVVSHPIPPHPTPYCVPFIGLVKTASQYLRHYNNVSYDYMDCAGLEVCCFVAFHLLLLSATMH